MGLVEKVRGEPRWRLWIHAAPQFSSGLLVLLGHARQLYMAIHEYRIKRARWVRGLTLQTTDPAEE